MAHKIATASAILLPSKDTENIFIFLNVTVVTGMQHGSIIKKCLNLMCKADFRNAMLTLQEPKMCNLANFTPYRAMAGEGEPSRD